MSRLVTFLILFAFWMMLSGMFDAFHLFLGVIACGAVAYFSAHLLFPDGKVGLSGRNVLGMALYLPWLFWQIVVANLQVAKIVLHPRMLDLINPQIVRFKTSIKSPFARVTFGQSITLTPGTITINIDRDEFTVYALTDDTAASLPGEMEKRVAAALEKEQG
ncbi:Na+/H+ antiporter subunit E [Geoalkalibacter halelectricus]|uniref:Na+/H+ antiporter subunit E n=1 Tax=Geoalkalibacter halelectricus TaxID=2847045 RepID=A0ABY5ZN44_9BACT|nr:Na+/H+ antiporter subunit E [Geoalkalibacter halelectricus]MDO3378305.1 Na+/H+ antiporter subunit E [Geoalkalibacter halelectricus]UWZ79310.1 Na+/H+ antiporter subunit E [Geoalkalibacter halelectricus]